MTQIKFYSIDDLPEEQEEWLVDGLICPSLTLLSAQPKHGKSLLAGHCATALINQTEVLDRKVKEGHHVIGWMGYDPDWRQELRQNWQSVAQNRIKIFEPLRNASPKTWRELAETLMSQSVTLFVIDHLYGVAGATGLNDANEVFKILELIRPIYDEFGIAVLLLSQASKSDWSKGRAAHSVAIEGDARSLIRIYEKRNGGSRKVDVSSNMFGEDTLHVTLTNTEFTMRSKVKKDKSTPSERDSPDRVREFLTLAQPLELTRGWKGAGRELYRLGWSTSPNAGRAMAKRWEGQNLLQCTGLVISAGSSLIPYNDINVA
jgi:hypothetical protein